MAKWKAQRFTRPTRRVPGWLWRPLASAGLGGAVLATVVPWAQAQRGYPGFGGEFILALAAFVLPFIILRR